MCGIAIAGLLLLASASEAPGQARVIITEIMYNPASKEVRGETEWVELANVGTEPIEIKDWRLDDEDDAAWGQFSCTLAPGGVLVLVNAAAVDEAKFRASWDSAGASGNAAAAPAYQVIAVEWSGLANSPSADNEALRLVDDKDEVVCEVKQEGQWPSCEKPDGSSIWLSDIKAASLSDGALWRRSETGTDGAHTCAKTEVFGGADIGSPGFVPGLTPAIATPATKQPDTGPSDAPDNSIKY